MPTAKLATIFDELWIKRAKNSKNNESWAKNAVEHNTGESYLATLRLWFDRFPLPPKQKKALAMRIESLSDVDHLGVVNEFTWWEFLQKERFKAIPIHSARLSAPDFQVFSPSEFFVEVSTLNISEQDKSKFETKTSVELDHFETLRRIIKKLTPEKQRQFSYAAARKKPCVLVLFDYTTWSGFGTQLYRFLADFLLGKQCGFKIFPTELSALVYVERRVLCGRIAISRIRSATYYNPYAKFLLNPGMFGSLMQFSKKTDTVDTCSKEAWIYL